MCSKSGCLLKPTFICGSLTILLDLEMCHVNKGAEGDIQSPQHPTGRKGRSPWFLHCGTCIRWPYVCWLTFCLSIGIICKGSQRNQKATTRLSWIFLFILSPSLTPILLTPSGFLCALFESGNLNISPDFTKGNTWLHLVDFANYYNSLEFKPLYLKLIFRYIVLFCLYLDILLQKQCYYSENVPMY